MIDNIIGHDSSRYYLKRLIEDRENSNFFPSSLFFRGPSGVGKELTALEFSKSLNCPQKGNCDEENCPSCTQIEKGIHPDVHQFEPETQNDTLKIREVRDLLGKASSQRMSGLFNIFIILHAHTITPEGADALLKTVEDGKGHSLFIFTSDRPQWVVRTLRSRSISLPFHPLASNQIREVLDQNEDRDHEDSKYRTAIQLSRGSVERALFFLDGDGFELRRKALGFFRGLVKGVPAHKTIDFIQDRIPSNHQWEFLDLVISFVRDILYLSEDVESAVVNTDQIDFLRSISESGSLSISDLTDAVDPLLELLNRKHVPIQQDHALISTMLQFQQSL